MVAYEETVRLPRFLSPLRALGHITGTIVAAALLYWSEFRGRSFGSRSWPDLIPAAYLALDFLPVLKILNGAFFPELYIRIDETTLTLKRGLIQRRIPLDSIVETCTVTAERAREPLFFNLSTKALIFFFLIGNTHQT